MLMQNVRYAVRLLWKAPGFTSVAVLTLALGIGANTAMFSVVDAVLLRPLPYRDPARLVSLWEGRTDRPVEIDRTHGSPSAVAPANLADYARESRSFESLAGYAPASMGLARSGVPEQLLGEAVTWNYFSTLGVGAAMGRTLTPADDRPGAGHVVMLADRLWRQRFGADPSILGRSIVLDGEPYTVVGVMPPAFVPLTQFGAGDRRTAGPAAAPAVVFFVPAAYSDELLASHGDHEVNVVGRLKAGVSIDQARADIESIAGRLAERYPREAGNLRALIGPLGRDIARRARAPLLVLLGAVALVLLVACVNVANLLIVRAVGQRREVAIRLAIGASRGQIAGDLLTRGAVLGLLGGALGLLCGAWTRDALLGLAPASIPRLDEVALNRDVFAATAVLSVATGMLAGLLPAWQASRTDPGPALKTTELTTAGGRSILRWRGVLLAGEIAAAFVLAVGAGLLVRSLVVLTRVDLGFDTDHVIAASIALPDSRYGDAVKRFRFFDDLAVRVAAMPGVQTVAFANRLPMRGGWSGSFQIIGVPPVGRDADLQAVSPGYFSTLGIPLLRGRLLDAGDRPGARPVAVVSEMFVRLFLPDRNPIGQQIRRNERTPPITIVGVVGQIRRDGQAAATEPEVYLPAAQTDLYPVRLSDFAVRTAGDPRTMARAIEGAVARIDPDQPLTNIKTLDDVLLAALAERRFNLTLLAVFASVAVALALIGVYGVVAYAAAQRTREIGIRVALGASTADVVRLVIRDGCAWALGGVAAGLVVASALTRVMRALLFEVTPTDPPTFLGMAALMIAVALSASYVPARRAALVNPISALRSE